jgi:hypothetical protein
MIYYAKIIIYLLKCQVIIYIIVIIVIILFIKYIKYINLIKIKYFIFLVYKIVIVINISVIIIGYYVLNNGFVYSNFTSGLSTKEAFIHGKAGREGLITTSLSVSDIGYLKKSS